MYQRDISACYIRGRPAQSTHCRGTPSRPTNRPTICRTVRSTTDYRMASRALVERVSRGLVAAEDVCDAHPELLRAAANIGKAASRECPICSLADARARVPRDEADSLRLVTYVFGSALKRLSGHIVWERGELDELAREHDSFTAYVVECCLVCGWNHLVESYLLGRRHAV
jgi:hypothetical protein